MAQEMLTSPFPAQRHSVTVKYIRGNHQSSRGRRWKRFISTTERIMAVIPALERRRQKVILGYFARQRPACTARNFLPNTKPNKIWKSPLEEGGKAATKRGNGDVDFGYKIVSEIKKSILWWWMGLTVWAECPQMGRTLIKRASTWMKRKQINLWE